MVVPASYYLSMLNVYSANKHEDIYDRAHPLDGLLWTI